MSEKDEKEKPDSKPTKPTRRPPPSWTNDDATDDLKERLREAQDDDKLRE